MKFTAVLSVLAAVLLAACSTDTPTSAPSTPLMKKAHSISWTLRGTLERTTSPAIGYYFGRLGVRYTNHLTNASGCELSHLGRVSGFGDALTTAFFDASYNTTSGTISATGEIVAANGDVLYIAMGDPDDATKGDWAVTGVDDNGAPIVSHDADDTPNTWTITGGTGRFEGATGGGTYTGTHWTYDNSWVQYMEGTIEY